MVGETVRIMWGGQVGMLELMLEVRNRVRT